MPLISGLSECICVMSSKRGNCSMPSSSDIVVCICAMSPKYADVFIPQPFAFAVQCGVVTSSFVSLSTGTFHRMAPQLTNREQDQITKVLGRGGVRVGHGYQHVALILPFRRDGVMICRERGPLELACGARYPHGL